LDVLRDVRRRFVFFYFSIAFVTGDVVALRFTFSSGIRATLSALQRPSKARNKITTEPSRLFPGNVASKFRRAALNTLSLARDRATALS
jgi:hypothetical protein